MRVTSGTTTTLTSDPAGQDAVAQDDFIYGEPLPGLVAFRLDARARRGGRRDGRADRDAPGRQRRRRDASPTRPPTARPRPARTTPRRAARSPSAPARRPSRSQIAISADNANEADESFTVALSNASGAALAAPRTETVTIQDRTPAKKAKLKVKLFRLLSPGLRFAIASTATAHTATSSR